MRCSALIPVVLSAGALVLSFLCLFAGSKKGFMEDYAIITLNTSRIGENVLNTSSSSSNPFVNFLDGIGDDIKGDLNNDVNDLAQALGVHDFYSAHVLDYCEGYYLPGAVPNATVPASNIHKNVTACSNKTAMFSFDPQTVLQQELNQSGHSNIDLSDLNWPDEINNGLHALKIAQRAVFVLYCIAIGFTFIALLLGLMAFFGGGRLSAFVNVLVDFLAFLALGIASAIVTAVAIKATRLINQYGEDIDVNAQKGNKFMILTWVATGVMFLSSLMWCLECIAGRKHSGGRGAYADEPKR